MYKIGLISDTHGLLRPEIAPVFKGVNLILHAGDAGNAEILEGLGKIAPVHVVRGNIDVHHWAYKLDNRKIVTVENKRIYMIHNIKEVKVNSSGAEYDIILCGHSHKPLIEETGKVLVVNPGSAGPRRFNLPVTVGLLYIDNSHVKAEIIKLLP